VLPVDFCSHSAALVTSTIYHPTYRNVVYQLTVTLC